MAQATIKNVKPSYELTVYEAILAFVDSMNGNVPVWEKEGGSSGDPLIYKAPIIKTLGITPDVSSKKLYASGVVYDVTTRTKGATAKLGVVALGREITDKALGAKVLGSVSYDRTMAQGKEFAFAYYCEMSDGSLVYYFHPRCKLVPGEENHNSSDDSDPDPEASYDIEIMPTSEGIWRVRYYTKDVAAGKTPLTLDAFVSALPYTIAQIEALPGLEQAGE